MSDPTGSAGIRAGMDSIERAAYREGFGIGASVLPGIFAWGMVTGMAMMKSGLSLGQALGMTFLVYAGSAQLASLPLMVANVPVLIVFITAMVVNLRFVIFAAAIGPHFAHLPWYKRLWCGYFNTDVTIALFPQRFPLEMLYKPEGKVGFYLGIGYPIWLVWQAGSVVGILLASQIPQSWGVGFAGTLALLAVTIPLISNAAALAGVAVSGTIAVAAAGLPYRLGLLVGIVGGIMAAMAVDDVCDKRKSRETA
ncbi:MAG TPA: AzlC family ABC transporter permease [Burkholderiaceae bacterium]|nr:AzlC family ABC transporter permease [Burkholderiaceae bacterium]